MGIWGGNQVGFGSGGWYQAILNIWDDGAGTDALASIFYRYFTRVSTSLHDSVNQYGWSDPWGSGTRSNFPFSKGTGVADVFMGIGGNPNTAQYTQVYGSGVQFGFSFWVQGLADGSGGGGRSTAAITYTTPARTPTAPGGAGLNAFTNITHRSFMANISVPANNGSNINLYQYRWNTTNNFDGFLWFNHSGASATIGGSTPSHDTNAGRPNAWLARNTTYYVQVAAHNPYGWGAFSNTGSVRTLHTAPDAGAISDGGTTATSIKANTTDPAYVGAGITSRRTEISTTSDFASILAFSGSVDPTFSGLTRATTYYLRYRTENAVGTSAWSGTLTKTTLQTAASAPTSPMLTPVTPTSMSVTFAAPTDDGGSAITTYISELATNNTFTANRQTRTGTSPHTYTGLSPDTAYFARVLAVNGANGTTTNGAWSSTMQNSTASGISGVPNPDVYNLSARSISVSAAVVNDAGATPVEYLYQISTSTGFSPLVYNVQNEVRVRTGIPLLPATTYFIRARSANPNGTSAFSATETFTTPTATALAPIDFRMTGATNTSVSLAWLAPLDTGGLPLTNYSVDYSLSSSPYVPIGTRNTVGTGTTFVLGTPNSETSILLPDTTYFVRVRANNSAGGGVWSAPIEVRTGQGAPFTPAIVIDEYVATTVQEPNGFIITWEPVNPGAYDSVGNPVPLTYHTQVSESPTFSTITTILSGTSGRIFRGTPGVRYYFRTRAETALGAGEYSNVVTAALPVGKKIWSGNRFIRVV